MIVLEQVQYTVYFIQYIHRGKSNTYHLGNIVNANISYPLDIKAVYLPSQWRYLFKQ
jgi:hypothetical protein